MSMGSGQTSTLAAFPACRFYVQVDGVMSAVFTAASGLSLKTELWTYTEGGYNGFTHKRPTRTSGGNVTLKRGLAVDNALLSWYLRNINAYGLAFQRRSVTVLMYPQLDRPSAPKLRFHLDRAFPVAWSGPSLEAASNGVAVETLELAHEGLDVEVAR